MKKLLILLSAITATTAYSVVTAKLDVNATLVKPLSIEANAKTLFGSVSKAGGKAVLSKVDLLVSGNPSAKVKISAPKDVEFVEKAPGTLKVKLQSKFSTASTSVGTKLETDLSLDALGEVETVYHIEGMVAAMPTVKDKAELEADVDITVAYN